MHEVVEIVLNEGATDSTVVMQPWGMPLRLPARHSFRIVARAPTAGQLEVVRQPDRVIVFGWPGSTAEVFDGDRLVDEFPTPVPSVPPGKTVKQFLDLMGLSPPGDRPDDHAR
jgi:hypothetical protein